MCHIVNRLFDCMTGNLIFAFVGFAVWGERTVGKQKMQFSLHEIHLESDNYQVRLEFGLNEKPLIVEINNKLFWYNI